MNVYKTSTGIQCGILVKPKPLELTNAECKIQSAFLPNFLKIAKARIRDGN